MILALFAYAFVSNVALAVVPHEPVVIWYGPRLGVWMTALIATAGTVAAAWVDHRLFVPVVRRLPAGLLAALFLLLLIPSVRVLLWPRRPAS